jgi:hypothetical protein
MASLLSILPHQGDPVRYLVFYCYAGTALGAPCLSAPRRHPAMPLLKEELCQRFQAWP